MRSDDELATTDMEILLKIEAHCSRMAQKKKEKGITNLCDICLDEEANHYWLNELGYLITCCDKCKARLGPPETS